MLHFHRVSDLQAVQRPGAVIAAQGQNIGGPLLPAPSELQLLKLKTVIIAYVVKTVIGLPPAPEVERQGLDITEHGKEGCSA